VEDRVEQEFPLKIRSFEKLDKFYWVARYSQYLVSRAPRCIKADQDLRQNSSPSEGLRFSMGHRAIELLIIPSVATVCLTLAMSAAWKSLFWAFGYAGSAGSRRS